ncbi:MAG: zinc ribbon domain-containing protein [Opitutales bacterium]
MASSSLAKLLILQDRDQRCSQVQASLAQWPLERANTERDIAHEKERVAAVEKRLSELEIARKHLEGQVADAEEKIVKYRTQQLQVKKQEEYTALEHEVTTLRETIDDWETEELDLLDAIDHAENELEVLKEEVAANIATYEAHLRTLDEGHAAN